MELIGPIDAVMMLGFVLVIKAVPM